jgi:hypothetical protein
MTGTECAVSLKPPMARHLFIVSRHHVRMHAYLQERFQGDDKVELILDRRMAQRRSSVGAHDDERRRSDRRARPELDIELRARSHVIISLPEPDDVEPRQS